MDASAILTEIRAFRHPERWVSLDGGIAIAVFAGMAGTWAAAQVASGIAVVLTAFGAPCLAFGGWHLGRMLYWWTGDQRKVGISFHGRHQYVEELLRARASLSALTDEREAHPRISLRLYPQARVRSEARRLKVRAHHRLTALLVVEALPPSRGNSGPDLQCRLDFALQQELSNEFEEATKAHIASILRSRPPDASVSDALQARVHGLFEVLLMVLGLQDLCARQHEAASMFFHCLELRLADRFQTTIPPRLAIRWLDQTALSQASIYPGGDPPGTDQLEKATSQCELAIERYDRQFSGPFFGAARNLFFLGRLDEALALVNQLEPGELDDQAKAFYYIDLAAMNTLLGHWNKSADAFRMLHRMDHTHLLRYEDLIEFADCAAEMEYSDAIFLQGLYRRIVGSIASDPALELRVLTWLNADTSRRGLQKVYFSVPAEGLVEME